MQKGRNSSVSAMELLLFCNKPSICCPHLEQYYNLSMWSHCMLVLQLHPTIPQSLSSSYCHARLSWWCHVRDSHWKPLEFPAYTECHGAECWCTSAVTQLKHIRLDQILLRTCVVSMKQCMVIYIHGLDSRFAPPGNEEWRYFEMTSLIGWSQT